MAPLLIALLAGIGFVVAYHTYGRWLGRRVFKLAAGNLVPSAERADGRDFVPTSKAVVFGHHFTSIAGTGPIVGPAIAVMWGWLPALLWVVLGSIFVGAVHDFGSLVVSLRKQGRTVGDIAGDVLNRRVRLLFLVTLFLCLLIVIAIFGLVIASVLKLYPAAIFPVLVQIPIALAIGVWLHRRGVSLVLPSVLALVLMYTSVIWGDWGPLHAFNAALAAWPVWAWVVLLLAYGYVASVLPVWTLLQPRDFINALQLLTALGLIVVGLVVAAFIGGAPPVEGAERVPLTIVAPAVNWSPAGAPPMLPFLFITIACGACSGFHCLVSSGTSSKQLKSEPDARFVGYGAMLTEGFLATLVILACVAGLGLGGLPVMASTGNGSFGGAKPGLVEMWPVDGRFAKMGDPTLVRLRDGRWYLSTAMQNGQVPPDFSPGRFITADEAAQHFGPYSPNGANASTGTITPLGSYAFTTRYASWQSAGGLGAKVGAFVDGAGNFVAALGVPAGIATALMAVLVASFAGTTLDTAVRLQRYVLEELWAAVVGRGFAQSRDREGAPRVIEGRGGSVFDRTSSDGGVEGVDGASADTGTVGQDGASSALPHGRGSVRSALGKHVATGIAVLTAAALAAVPDQGAWSLAGFGRGGLVLWPLFGASNQLLAGLAFAVILFWLRRSRVMHWFLIPPMLLMLIVPAWAMMLELPGWWNEGRYVLAGIGGAVLALELWIVVEAAVLWGRVRADQEPRGFEVVGAGS